MLLGTKPTLPLNSPSKNPSSPTSLWACVWVGGGGGGGGKGERERERERRGWGGREREEEEEMANGYGMNYKLLNTNYPFLSV